MKLSGRGHRFACGLAQPGGGPDRLADLAATLQLMRGRYAATSTTGSSAL